MNVLIVDDDPNDASELCSVLRGSKAHSVDVVVADNLEQARGQIQ